MQVRPEYVVRPFSLAILVLFYVATLCPGQSLVERLVTHPLNTCISLTLTIDTIDSAISMARVRSFGPR